MTAQAWRDDALCIGTPEWWWYAPFGENEDDTVVEEAAALCVICPVRVQCLEHALVMEDFGFWANTTPAERRQRRKRAGIRLHVIAEIPTVVGVAEMPPLPASPSPANGRGTTSSGPSAQGGTTGPWTAPPIWAASTNEAREADRDDADRPSETSTGRGR